MTEVGAEASAEAVAVEASAEGSVGVARRLPRARGFAEWPVQGSPKQEGRALRKQVLAVRTARSTWTVRGPTR